MSRPRLLYLAFFYPPSRASGVYRAIATSQVFAAAGWDVTVLTVDEQFLDDELGSSDRSLEQQIPGTVRVERVPFTMSRHGEFPFRTASWLDGYLPGLYFKRQERQTRLEQARGEAFPDRYASWIEPVVERVTGMAGGFDHILATGNPYASFEAARILAPTYGVDFSVDYRDPWSFDVATSTPIGDPVIEAAESRIIGESAYCFHVNSAIAHAYAASYPGSEDKHLVAMNGFDSDSLGRLHRPRDEGPHRFGIVGTLTERWPLEAMFSGWRTALDSLPPDSRLVLAGYLGFFESRVGVIDSLLPGSLQGFEYVGPIPKESVGAFNESLDVIITPVPEGEMVTGSKIFEALAVGVPVVCIQSRGGGARVMLDDHPYAFGAEPNAESVAAALVAASTAAREMTPEEPQRIRSSMGHLERLSSLTPLIEAVTTSVTAGTSST